MPPEVTPARAEDEGTSPRKEAAFKVASKLAPVKEEGQTDAELRDQVKAPNGKPLH